MLLLAGGEFLGNMQSGAGDGPVHGRRRSSPPPSGWSGRPSLPDRSSPCATTTWSWTGRPAGARRGPAPHRAHPQRYRLLPFASSSTRNGCCPESSSAVTCGPTCRPPAPWDSSSRGCAAGVDEEGDTLIHTRRGFGYWLGRPAHF
ncbi:hypothetical protein LV779_08585 [Streptomyces thinghirensis]|nr:hypothetical protein [Streptomyces thinghirensis]